MRKFLLMIVALVIGAEVMFAQTANIENVWVDYNVNKPNTSVKIPGMLIHIKFNVNGLKNNEIRITANFYYKDKKTKIFDSYWGGRGKYLIIEESCTPTFDYSTYNNIQLFVPYYFFQFKGSLLDSFEPDTYSFFIAIQVKNSWKQIETSPWYDFQWSDGKFGPPVQSATTITFLSETTSTSPTYNLQVMVKSSSQITSKIVSVNGISRGLNVIKNDGYDLEINQTVSLNRGNNTITVSITNGSGTTTKSLNVYVSDKSTPPTEKRVALVIGNSNYPQAPLINPVNDATDMAAKLRLLGFDVTLQTNLSHSGFDNALKSFKSKANYCDVALLYYAGHGMEIDGNNYLIPVDAPINDIDQLKYKSVDAYYALDILSGAKKKIIILDACRNNPSTRGALHGGLAAMNATNALIAYSTSPGKTAADGSGRNSPYTYALLNALNNKNLTLPQLFQMVAKNVSAQKTGQIPWYVSSLVEDVILNR